MKKNAAPTAAQTPSVTAPQTEVSAATAESVTLSVTARTDDGGVLTYQWYKIAGDGSAEAVNGTRSSYTFQTPSDEGWTALKYRVTVTNTLTLADGKTLTAQKSVDFTVTEDNRPPMPEPYPSISVRVADSDGKERGEKNVSLFGDDCYYIGIHEDYLIEVTVPNYDGGEISCQWTGANIYPEANCPTPQPVPQQFETTGSSNYIVYSLQGRFDEAPPVYDFGQRHYQYTIEITSADPEGMRRPATSVRQFKIQVQLPLTIRFDAGKGTFSDGTRQKERSIPCEILRSRPDDSVEHKNNFYFNREDFSDWMKEIGMRNDVIGDAISYSVTEFDDWTYTNPLSQIMPWNSDYYWKNYFYSYDPVTLEHEYHIVTFTAKWRVDDTLLEKMNKLFQMDILKMGLTNPLEAYKAEYSDEEDKTRVYYDVELVNVARTNGDSRTVTAVANGKEQKKASMYGITTGMIHMKFQNKCGLSNEEVTRYWDKEKHFDINILPTANCTDAAEEDIAVFYSAASDLQEYDVLLSRKQGGPAGYFVYRLEIGHTYRIQFCLYIDHEQQKYGVEYFRWKDTTDPSAEACMYVPGYAVKTLNYPQKYAFYFQKDQNGESFDPLPFGQAVGSGANFDTLWSGSTEYSLLDKCFDFDNKKIYLYLRSSSSRYSATSNWYTQNGDGDVHLESLNLEIFGLSEDGKSLAEVDGGKGISYHSFEPPVHFVPAPSKTNEIITNRNENIASYRPMADLHPSTEEKDEPGFTLKLEDDCYHSFILRLDVTEVPPRIQILEAP